jgi:hypothetical protein
MQHDFLYLLLVQRVMLSKVQTIQYLMIEVSMNNDLEVELVPLHHLLPGRARYDYSYTICHTAESAMTTVTPFVTLQIQNRLQLHHLSHCRVSSDYPPVRLQNSLLTTRAIPHCHHVCSMPSAIHTLTIPTVITI